MSGDMAGSMSCDDATLSLGAYLLGSLDETDGVAVEAHLRDCESCRAELADLAALPSLLERLTLDDFALEPPAVPDDLFDRVAARARDEQEQDNELAQARATKHRRYRRLTAAAAAVVVIAGGTVGAVTLTDHHSSSRPEVAQVISNGISMRVTLASQTSGTSLRVNVSGLPENEHCQLVAVTKNGSRKVVGQWYATYHGVAQVTGSTSIARSDLSELVLLGTNGQQLVTASV